jgi:hypothetical protein
MRNRKQLPHYGPIELKINIEQLIEYCQTKNYLDYEKYRDVNYSTSERYKNFLLTHQYCKDTFFKEDVAPSLEGADYRQLYLTEIDSENTISTPEQILKSSETIYSRVRRSIKGTTGYIPEADETKYNKKTVHYSGVFENILSQFISPITRVRLAVLMPGAKIMPHVDYDPSYIVRYHIPIITNELVRFGHRAKNADIEYTMPADGRVYFFNSGLLHWVNNNSNHPRLHLIVDTNGQDDLNLL